MRSDDAYYLDEADVIARQHDDESQALFVAESDQLEALLLEQFAAYQKLQLGWGSIGRVIASVMDWPDFRNNDDALVMELRQYAAEYSWPAVWNVFARAMQRQLDQAA